MTYDIIIHINEVKTNDLDKLEEVCEMLTELCNTVCNKCDWDAIRSYCHADYELKEVKE